MEKRTMNGAGRSQAAAGRMESREDRPEKRTKKMSAYGKQLHEKQNVKEMYGLRERQFRNWFDIAAGRAGGAGENLLSMLERRLDNVVYRLKLANSRSQARQLVVHGHVTVNGKKVSSPSYQLKVNDEVALTSRALGKAKLLEAVVDKRLNIGVKVPDWLELMKDERKGKVLRFPVRTDIQTPIEEHLIVELYSK